MKQFNGKWGCNYCEDEGVPCRSCHLHCNWPYEESVVLRTHQSMMQNARDSKASSILMVMKLIRPNKHSADSVGKKISFLAGEGC